MQRKRPCKEVLVTNALLFDSVKSYLFSEVLRCWVTCTHWLILVKIRLQTFQIASKKMCIPQHMH